MLKSITCSDRIIFLKQKLQIDPLYGFCLNPGENVVVLSEEIVTLTGLCCRIVPNAGFNPNIIMTSYADKYPPFADRVEVILRNIGVLPLVIHPGFDLASLEYYQGCFRIASSGQLSLI